MYYYERAVYWKTSDPPNILNYPYTNFFQSGPFAVFLFKYFFYHIFIFYQIFRYYSLPGQDSGAGDSFMDKTVPDIGFVLVTRGPGAELALKGSGREKHEKRMGNT